MTPAKKRKAPDPPEQQLFQGTRWFFWYKRLMAPMMKRVESMGGTLQTELADDTTFVLCAPNEGVVEAAKLLKQ